MYLEHKGLYYKAGELPAVAMYTSPYWETVTGFLTEIPLRGLEWTPQETRVI